MRNINLTLIILGFLTLTLIACQDNNQMGPEDTFLGSDVPRFPITNDYNVGAFYKFSNCITWNDL